MGVDDVVTSPTFALVRSYPSSFGVDLVHVDVYRLDAVSDIVALGLPEMLEDGAVAVVEWGGRAVPALGPDHLGIRIDLTDIDGERRMTLVPEGARWQARWEELRHPGARRRRVSPVTLLLGIATATSQVGVALAGLDGPLASLHVRQGRRHAELLAPAIEALTRRPVSVRNRSAASPSTSGPGCSPGCGWGGDRQGHGRRPRRAYGRLLLARRCWPIRAAARAGRSRRWWTPSGVRCSGPFTARPSVGWCRRRMRWWERPRY